MLLSSILAVAIGLFILWVVLSFVNIQIQEWINARLGKRARVIEDAIHEMLASPTLKAQFYEHPLIRGLTAKRRKRPSQVPAWFYRYPIVRSFARKKRILPSYIPVDRFASALFDLILTAGTESSLIQQGVLKLRDDLQERNGTAPHEVIDELNLLSEIAYSAAATETGTANSGYTLEMLKEQVIQFSENFNNKHPNLKLDPYLPRLLQDVMRQILEQADRIKKSVDDRLARQYKPDRDPLMAKLRQGIAGISVVSPELGQTLNALILEAETHPQFEDQSFSLVRNNVQKWFSDTMDRVSGVFRRYSQSLALIIGLYLAVLLNVDMISFTNFLWREAFIRQALLENASKFALAPDEFTEHPRQAMQDFRRQFVGLSLPPLGWSIKRTENLAFLDGTCQMFPIEGQAFGIPIPYTSRCVSSPESSDETNFFVKILGFLLTALAAAWGAPLWFDILKRLLRKQ